MNSEAATAHVISTLEDLGIDYVLVGALSSNVYGVLRATNGADIVVSFDSVGVVEFSQQLGDGFHLDRQMRIETTTLFNRNTITYTPTNFDIELFRLSNDDHHQQRFARRQRHWISELEREAWIPAAEDVVIQKLRWARQKDLSDVESMIGVCGKELDWTYIEQWATIHNTLEPLNQLRDNCPPDESDGMVAGDQP